MGHYPHRPRTSDRSAQRNLQQPAIHHLSPAMGNWSIVSTRSPRVNSDPDRYIRTTKGGKYQARPFDLGKRYDLGTFHTKAQARTALLKFWRGELAPKPRFTKKIYTREGTFYIAIVCIPGNDGVKHTQRVGGRYPTPAEAQGAAIEFLDATVGPATRAAMMSRKPQGKWWRPKQTDDADDE